MKRRFAALVSGAAAIALSILAGAPLQGGNSANQESAMILKPTPTSWNDSDLTLAYLGHAAVLMNYFGVRIISDPTFFGRVGLKVAGLFSIGPARLNPAPLMPAELPPIDLILITHAHMDHLDLPSLAALPRTAAVVTCARCADMVKELGFTDVRQLQWGEQTEIKGLTVSAMGARHWGKRWPWGEDLGYNSYVLEKSGVRMLLACDSAYTGVFGTVRNNPPQIAAFSIGAYDPWISSHANPEQVWDMFRQSGGEFLLPIHWGTFRLSKEPLDEPMERLIAAAGPDADRIVVRQIGGSWKLPPIAAAAAGKR